MLAKGQVARNWCVLPDPWLARASTLHFLSCSQESRDGRVDSWRNFQANTKGKKEKKNRTFLRPPKVKMEQRE